MLFRKKFTKRDDIQISIDAPEPLLFAEIRRGGNLDKVIASCNLLSKHHIKFKINMVITNKNYKYMKGVYQLAEQIHATQIVFSPLMNMGDDPTTYLPEDDELLNSFAEVLEYHFQAGEPVDIKQDPLAVPWGNKEIHKYMHQNFLVCPAGKTEVEIDMEGNVYTCPFLYKSEFCMGNVNRQSIKDIWNNKRFDIFSEKHWTKSSICQLCDSFETCNSGCIAYAINNKMDCDERCQKIKNALKNRK